MRSEERMTQPLGKIWMVLFALIILENLMPVVGRFISTFLTTYFLLIVALSILYYFFNWRLNRWVSLLSPLILITLINSIYSIRHGAPVTLIVFGDIMSFCPILIALRTQSLPPRQTKTLFKVMAFAVILTALTTISGLSSNQGASRILASIDNSKDLRLIQFEWLNIGGFSFTYILLTLYPLIIGFVKEIYDKLWLKILIIWLLATYYLSAEYMTGLMGFILISSLWLVPRRFPYKRLFAMLGIVLALFIVFQESIADVLYDSAASSKSDILQKRFLYMADGLSGVENTSDVGLREDVLMTSFEGIVRSPIFGNWYKGGGVGGHSCILDFISLYGIVGLVLIVASYRVIFRQFYAQYKYTPYYTYALMTFITAIILSTVNTGNHWLELTLLAPLTMKMISVIKSKRKQSQINDEDTLDN